MSAQRALTAKTAPRGFAKLVKTWRDDCDTKTDLLAKRQIEGWSLRELANFIGVSHATLSRVERGQEPSLSDALRIARFWELRVDDIWELRKETK